MNAVLADRVSRDWRPALDDMCLDRTAVVVLNTSIENPPMLVRRLWNECELTPRDRTSFARFQRTVRRVSALLRLTVDGGTNQWHRFAKQNDTFDDLKLPDIITGDLDSADPAVVDQFVSMGSRVVHTPNQDETDFFKALMEIEKHSPGKSRHCRPTSGSLSGPCLIICH